MRKVNLAFQNDWYFILSKIITNQQSIVFKNVIEELYIAIESTALVLGWIIQTSYFLLEILLEKP